MKQQLIKVALLLVLLFMIGGFAAMCQGIEIIGLVFIHIFPIFEPAFEQAILDYLKSPYFIVGVIIFIFSTFGIFLSVKEKKCLYAVVSGILNIISLISLISNFAHCA